MLYFVAVVGDFSRPPFLLFLSSFFFLRFCRVFVSLMLIFGYCFPGACFFRYVFFLGVWVWLLSALFPAVLLVILVTGWLFFGGAICNFV